MKKNIKTLSKLLEFIERIGRQSDGNILVYRGESEDYDKKNEKTALVPSVYRDNNLSREDVIFRESQRFNDHEFSADNTTFDRLSRIQHYSAPTRLIDVSDDLLSAVYFAIAEKDKKDKKDSIIYIFEIDIEKKQYYDSDTVSVISNLAKLPLSNNSNDKSKEKLHYDLLKYNNRLNKFNKQRSAKFLRNEIREEKPQFEPIINPKHLTSIQFVLPKLTSNRIRSQKGAFLLFGLNPDTYSQPIKILKNNKLDVSVKNLEHPIKKIHVAILKNDNIKGMKKELKNLGITKSFIYPEIDKVSEALKGKQL